MLKMKLAIETDGYIKRFGEEKAFEMIKKAGFDSVDYSFYSLDSTRKGEIFGDDYLIYAKKTRMLLDKIGLTCNQTHAPFEFKHNKDTTDMSNENYKILLKTLEISSILGAKYVVVHALRPATESETVLDKNMKYYKSFEPYLEKYQVHIAIENLFGISYDQQIKKYVGDTNRFVRPDSMKEIIEKLDSKWFVCCLDLGHAAITGIEPQDFIRGMDNTLLKVLHVHDNDYEQDKHWLPYQGKINWNEVAKSLKEINYGGDITFETNGFEKSFDNELIPSVLKLAEQTGRHLIRKIADADKVVEN